MSAKKSRALAACCLSSIFGISHTAWAQPDELTLPGLLTEVRQHSPLLQARQAVERAARTRRAQTTLWEDPMVMAELWQVPLSLERLPLMVTFKQPLPWIGTALAKKRQADAEASFENAVSQTQVRLVLLSATRAYFSYLQAHRSLLVLQQNRVVSQGLLASVDARFRVGKAEFQELLEAQAALTSLETAVLDVEQEKQSAEQQIFALLGKTQSSPLGVPVTLPERSPLSPVSPGPPLEELLNRAQKERSEIQSAERKGSVLRHRLQTMRTAPEFALWGSYMKSLRGDMDQAFSVGVQSNIPVFSGLRLTAAQKEVAALLQQNELETDQLRADVAAEVRVAYLRHNTALRHHFLHHHELSPLSKQAVAAAQAGVAAGRIPLSVLFSAIDRHLQHRLAQEKYLAQIGQTRAELDFAVGVEFIP